MVKRFIKVLLCVLGGILVLVVLFFGLLTVTEYRPEAAETLDIAQNGGAPDLDAGQELSVLSWNTGYGGLGRDADFFMDGGTGVRTANEALVRENLTGISGFVRSAAVDFALLQEVDSGSKRTWNIDERNFYTPCFQSSAYALNYSCLYVPYPLPTIGKVHSGILTLSGSAMDEAQRIALPSPFSWPVSTANLKRCLLVSRHPISGSEKELVLVNLHLEAYDDGQGKAAQTAMLRQLLEEEYAAGNYIIAGGDFNQSFPEALEAYPIKDDSLWTPGLLSDGDLGEGWRFAYDTSVPSCRLLNQPYDPDSPNTQVYVIDGFILSPNVKQLSVETVDAGFTWTDHNPVLLRVKLE